MKYIQMRAYRLDYILTSIYGSEVVFTSCSFDYFEDLECANIAINKWNDRSFNNKDREANLWNLYSPVGGEYELLMAEDTVFEDGLIGVEFWKGKQEE